MKNKYIKLLIILTLISSYSTGITYDSDVIFTLDSTSYSILNLSYDITSIYLNDNALTINNITLNITPSSSSKPHITLINYVGDYIELNITPISSSEHIFEFYNVNSSESFKVSINSLYDSRVLSDVDGYIIYEAESISAITNYIFSVSPYIKTLTYGCSDVHSSDESIAPLTSYSLVAYSDVNNTFNCQFPLLNKTQTNNLRKSCQWWAEDHSRWNFTEYGYIMDYTLVNMRDYDNGSVSQNICNLTGYIFVEDSTANSLELEFTRIPPFGNVNMVDTTNSLKVLYRLPEVDWNKTIDI